MTMALPVGTYDFEHNIERWSRPNMTAFDPLRTAAR